MYVLYKSKNILTLVTIGYIVGFIVGMYVEYCYGPKWPYWIYIAYIGLFGTSICRYYFWVELPVQRRLCPIFLKWRRVTRPPLIFRGLTGSQRTPGFWGVTAWYQSLGIRIPRELGFGYPSPLGGLMWSIGIWKPIDRQIWGLGHSWMRASPLGVVFCSV